jgi:glycosyltransferase involved in cell wall biosynthesis
VDVARSEVNGGPGAARNRGLALVETPWVAFVDADVIPASDWLATCERLVGRLDAPDLIEGRVRIPADTPPSTFTHATEIAPPEQHGAGNIVLRVETLRGLGGFDERFYDAKRRLHFREDTELAFRLEEAGATAAYEPVLLADHPPLAASFWSPVRLARRYTFDVLLDREHHDAFRRMNALRRVGPTSLRRARHLAALAVVIGVGLLVVGLLVGWWPVAAVGAVGAIVGWAATVVSLSWRKQVQPRHVLPLLVVGMLVPWAYVWAWERGVVRYRHWPRW